MKSVLVTRLQPQQGPVAALTRARLANATPVRLTFVVAPAGTGKSTLLAAREAAWVSLTKGDADLHTFLLYFLESLARKYEGLCPAARDLLLGQLEVPDRLPNLIVNELAAYAKPVEIVLDDLHLCFRSEIQEFLEFLLRHAPDNFCLSIASRHHLPLPLAWLKPRGLLRQIEESDLAFTLGETRKLVTEVWGLPLSERRLELLWRQTQGWVAAMQLATQSLLGRPLQWESYLEGVTGARKDIYAYLAAEVFANLPGDIQSFLLGTSCMEEWDLNAAGLVGGIHAAHSIEYIKDHRLFLEHVGGRIYRFHPLFREFLWNQLRARSDWPEVERRAGHYWITQNQPERAAVHFERLGEMDTLLRTHGLEMVLKGHHSAVTAWMLQIPSPRIQADSALSLLAGSLCEIKGHWQEAEAHYLRALRLGDGGAAWGHLCQSYLKCDRHHELLAACQRGLEDQPTQATRAQLLAWRGATLILTGQDWDQGYADILLSHELCQGLSCPHARFAAALAYGFAYLFLRGEIRDSLRFLEEASETFVAEDFPMPAYFLTMDRAVILLFTGSQEEALRLVEQTLLESRRAGHAFVYQGLETLKALIRLRQGDDQICQRVDLATLSPQFRPYWLAELLRYQVRSQQAHESCHTAELLLSSVGQGFYALECNLALAEWHRSMGDEERASHRLLANLDLCRRAQSSFWEGRTSDMLRDCPSRPGLYIQSFGALRMWHQGLDFSQELLGIPLKILAVLVASGERYLPVDVILDAVWPETDPRQARRSLSVHLTRLRKLLRVPEPIVRRGDQYRLNLGPLLEVDSVTFEGLCRAARNLHIQGAIEALAAAHRKAEGLWKGPFLVEQPYLDLVSERRLELENELDWLRSVSK